MKKDMSTHAHVRWKCINVMTERGESIDQLEAGRTEKRVRWERRRRKRRRKEQRASNDQWLQSPRAGLGGRSDQPICALEIRRQSQRVFHRKPAKTPLVAMARTPWSQLRQTPGKDKVNPQANQGHTGHTYVAVTTCV